MSFNRYRSAVLVIIVFVLYLSWCSRPVWAGNSLVLTDETGEYDLAPYVEVLEESGGRLTIDDVLKPEAIRQFVPHVMSSDLNEGFAQQARWVRMPLRNNSHELEWLLIIGYPPMDRIDYYVVANGVPVRHLEAGDLIPFGKKPTADREHTFQVELQRDQDIVLLLRLETEGAMIYPMTLADSVHYAKRQQTAGLLLGGYYGVMLAMTLYNSIMAFSLRSRTNGYYVLTNASVLGLFATFNGISFQYVWPDAVWWNNRAIVFFICAAHIGVLLFARNFLDLKRFGGKLHTVFSYLIGFEVLNLFLLAVSYPTGFRISMYSIGFMDVMILVAGAVSVRRGSRPARFFLLGWSVFALGIVITAMTEAGYLPHTSFTAYASQMGSIFEAVILSWGLASQISIIKREKDQAVAQMKETSRLADLDDLTGLYTRRYVLRTFQQVVYNTDVQAVSLLLLDVDHFKQVNDTYGHDIGDSVLQQMAHVLQDCFRPTDIVGRFGGEEFIVLLPDSNMEQAAWAAEYLLQTLRRKPFEAGEHSLACTVSVGIAEWNGLFEDDFERMLRRADEALYEAKRSGRNRICTRAAGQRRMQEEA